MTPTLAVLSGPFEGMTYPKLEAFGSSLSPKLLGTYERELFSAIESLRSRGPFEAVHNIGSAEGYYSVGLVLAGVVKAAICYDTSAVARSLSTQLAAKNGVSAAVRVEGHCSRETLLSLDPSRRALILSDCEGFEASLFDARTAGHLKNADVLIEVHEHLGASLDELCDSFRATHDLEVIRSISDWSRADYDSPPAFTETPRTWRLLLAAELRADMCWLLACSKSFR